MLRLKTIKSSFMFSTIPSWATVDPFTLNSNKPHTVQNLLNGKWATYRKTVPIVDPLNDGVFLNVSTPEGK